MGELIDFLEDVHRFSILDANSGNLKREVDKADREKTALTLHHCL